MELLRTFLGYCYQCRRPCVVGEFKIPGWRHVFTMCEFCLGKLREKIIDQSKHAIQTETVESEIGVPQ